MTYTKKQFLEDVAKEAVALKKNATKVELGKLEIEELDPNNRHECIFGQITGDCFSARASELIHKCCKRYFLSNNENGETIGRLGEDARLVDFVNGDAIPEVTNAGELLQHRKKFIFHLSSIEAYIFLPTAKNKNLIDFLKGNRTDLVL